MHDLKIKLFADGADKTHMLELYQKPHIQGFTTNPSLMRKAGISNYKAFALDILQIIKDKPISFEVLADDLDTMKVQALEIASWGANVYVKIPIMTTRGEPTTKLIQLLAYAGVKQNITAIMTLDQVYDIAPALAVGPAACISIFAGRIADTGRDPLPIMQKALDMISPYEQLELLWASPRELLNVFQANEMGCHIITATSDILKKLSLVGKDLHSYSLETVKILYDDAQAAGLELDIPN